MLKLILQAAGSVQVRCFVSRRADRGWFLWGGHQAARGPQAEANDGLLQAIPEGRSVGVSWRRCVGRKGVKAECVGRQSVREGRVWRKAECEGRQSVKEGRVWGKAECEGRQSVKEGRVWRMAEWRKAECEGRQSVKEGTVWRKAQCEGRQSVREGRV